MTPFDYCLIPLTQGQFAKVSPHRFEEINRFKWFACWSKDMQSFYAARTPWIDGKQVWISMHRLIAGLKPGDPRHADHRNHDTLDNTDDNVRVANYSQNGSNQRCQKRTKSGLKGVALHKRMNRYQAHIRVDKKLITLGTFPLTEEGRLAAARAYDEAAKKHFGEFAYLNFPEP